MPRVEGFLPSASGLHFPNSFDHVPLKTVQIPIVRATVTLGDAAHGLCGGMVYTVRDYFESQQLPPAAGLFFFPCGLRAVPSHHAGAVNRLVVRKIEGVNVAVCQPREKERWDYLLRVRSWRG